MWPRTVLRWLGPGNIQAETVDQIFYLRKGILETYDAHQGLTKPGYGESVCYVFCPLKTPRACCFQQQRSKVMVWIADPLPLPLQVAKSVIPTWGIVVRRSLTEGGFENSLAFGLRTNRGFPTLSEEDVSGWYRFVSILVGCVLSGACGTACHSHGVVCAPSLIDTVVVARFCFVVVHLPVEADGIVA